MKENNLANCPENQIIPLPYHIEVLTQEEERKLVSASYGHQYGILIRLALFTGLETSELLGLQWKDVDFCNNRLCIQHELIVEEDGLDIRTASSPRVIPVFSHLLTELADWGETLANTISSSCRKRNSVATMLNGQQVNWGMLDYYFHEMAQSSGIPHYDFEVLRNTFAVRALEHGMDLKALSRILGNHAAASFYAYLAQRNAGTNMASADMLPTVQNRADLTSPVVARRLENGYSQIYTPNFPEFTMSGPILIDGLIIMREKIEYKLRALHDFPTPVPVSDIPCGLGECIIQISVKS